MVLGYQNSCAWNSVSLVCVGAYPFQIPPHNKILKLLLSQTTNGGCLLDQLNDGRTEVKCWGDEPLLNNVPREINLTSPVDLMVGNGTACALSKDYGALCWGSENIPLPPTVVRDLKKWQLSAKFGCLVDRFGLNCFGDMSGSPELTLPTDLDITQVKDFALGLRHACVIFKSNSVRCWGDDSNDQIKSAPANLKNPISIVAAGNYTCATDDEGVKCWGQPGWSIP
jgi:hypothetical protein